MEPSIGQLNRAPGTEALLLGELHPLLEQLGSLDGLAALHATSDSLLCPKIDCLETLEGFLEAYQAQLLYPVELPAIAQAYYHASRNETRELMALDQKVARYSLRPDLARASQRVGQYQLQRLRPLRDQRLIRRYLQAVAQNQAHGWHTLIFGLTLAVYSLPVRQGLFGYARQTLQGFIQVAARPLHLSTSDCQALLERQCHNLPRQLEKVVGFMNPR